MKSYVRRAAKKVFDMAGMETPLLSERAKFYRAFARNLAACDWQPHPRYSVFTQYDGSFYLTRKEDFLRKYRSMWAVSRTISPQKIIELGTHAGSSADAYLSATPSAFYVGIDKFCSDETITHEATGDLWRPMGVAEQLFKERGFVDYELVLANLRDLKELSYRSDLVVVDAAHDPFSEYEDLKLALTANPTWLFVDDAAPSEEAWPGIEKFLREDLQGRVEFTCPVKYTGGGLVIKLKTP